MSMLFYELISRLFWFDKKEPEIVPKFNFELFEPNKIDIDLELGLRNLDNY